LNPRVVSDVELTTPSRQIFLSPHYDDIALSCGGTAAKITNLGGQPEVGLIFGDHPDPVEPLTEFAESLHKQWGLDASQVIAGRRSEEAAASAVLGTHASFLPFRDAIYRGRRYMNDDQLFSSPAEDERELPRQIIAAVGLATGNLSDVRVYTPLAVGFHVDHQHAFLAGVQLAQAGADVWFYEDLPYGLKPGGRDKRTTALPVSMAPAVLVDVSAEWESKLDAIFAYPSQLSTIFVDYVGVGTTRAEVSEAMEADARGVGEGRLCERFWKVDGAS
jgi:LmbE family N-acetylglucosaminyl deacetylase